jgi:hypothetical protein
VPLAYLKQDETAAVGVGVDGHENERGVAETGVALDAPSLRASRRRERRRRWEVSSSSRRTRAEEDDSGPLHILRCSLDL